MSKREKKWHTAFEYLRQRMAADPNFHYDPWEWAREKQSSREEQKRESVVSIDWSLPENERCRHLKRTPVEEARRYKSRYWPSIKREFREDSLRLWLRGEGTLVFTFKSTDLHEAPLPDVTILRREGKLTFLAMNIIESEYIPFEPVKP